MERKKTLQRKTALRTKARLQRRTPLASVGERKREERKKTRLMRKIAFGEVCEACGVHPARDVHEVAAGSHRAKAVLDNNCQLRVCRACHEALQGRPYAEQVAANVLTRIAAVNRATSQRAVTIEAVIEHLEKWK